MIQRCRPTADKSGCSGRTRLAVNEEISKGLAIKTISHEIKPLFGSAGQPLAYDWVFHLSLENRFNKQIIGFAGYVTVKDAFGSEIGVFPAKLEYQLDPNKKIEVTPVLRLAVGESLFKTVRDLKTIFPEWFLESVAFIDGSRVDSTTVPAPSNTVTRARTTS